MPKDDLFLEEPARADVIDGDGHSAHRAAGGADDLLEALQRRAQAEHERDGGDGAATQDETLHDHLALRPRVAHATVRLVEDEVSRRPSR